MKAQRLPDDHLPINWDANEHRETVRESAAIDRATWTPGAVKPCLRCRAEFESQGYHNRLCHNCGTLVRSRQDAGVFAEGVSGHNAYGSRRRHGGS